MKVSIAIPVYNEEKTVKEVIEKVKKIKLPIEKEIIVVDDGSKDGSLEKIKEIKGIKIIGHEHNKGKGAAIKTALNNSTGDIFLIQDADFELDPDQIPKILDPILMGNADVVYGSRNWKINIKDGNRSPLFYAGGVFITFVTNFLFHTKLTDEPCGFKCYKTTILRSIKIKNDRFEFEPEITAKIAKKGIKIIEVPVVSKSRSIHQGKKLRRRDGLKALLTLIKYRII